MYLRSHSHSRGGKIILGPGGGWYGGWLILGWVWGMVVLGTCGIGMWGYAELEKSNYDNSAE